MWRWRAKWTLWQDNEIPCSELEYTQVSDAASNRTFLPTVSDHRKACLVLQSRGNEISKVQ